MDIFGIFDGDRVFINGQAVPCEEKLRVAFDGEIYNSEELCLALGKLGCVFGSQSDSELIAQAYTVWGEECLKKINGSFSLCIYDKEREIILLVRDHAGKKPLYYSDYNGKFIFASRVGSIIGIPGFPKEVNLTALNFYFAYRYVPEELSIFKHIKKLPAACALHFGLKSKRLEITPYWNPPRIETRAADENELAEELEEIVKDALSIRIKGGSPVGAFLSGGLDSSFLVALMSGLSSEPIKTFSVGFREEKHDETPFSRTVSRHFGTDHEELIIEPEINSLIQAASLFDEPFANPSIIPNYFAAKIAKQHVDAVISGDGADGLFLGLRTHLLSVKHGRIKKFLVPPFNWISGAVAEMLPQEARYRIFFENTTPEEFFIKRGFVFDAPLRKKLFKDQVLKELEETFYEPENRAASAMNSCGGTFLEKMGFVTFKSDADDSFFKVERIGKNFSLEVRTPFLDVRMVEFAFGRVPDDMKIRKGVQKYLLKRVAKKFLPPSLPLERKKGFNPPFAEWLKNEWWDYTRDILMSGSEDFIRKDYVDKLLKSHKSSVFDHGRKIFCLLVFKIWEEKYLIGDGLQKRV